LDLYPNPRDIASECEARGIKVLSVTTTPRAWRGTFALARESKLIMTALGIHPQLEIENDTELPLFYDLLPQTRFVGEIGIDGSKEFRNRMDTQRHIFRSILLACEASGGRVLSIHSKNAATEVLDELEKNVDASVPVLHWFSGTMKEIERASALNCWFSIGPSMFYSTKGVKLIERMPRNRILTETDSPFGRFKGQLLMPWNLENHYRRLGDILDIKDYEVGELIEDNCERLIRLFR